MPTIDSARPYYPENDPVHGFDHIKRVYRLAERLAVEMGADLEIVRAAALLHDAVGEAAAGEENPAEAAKPDAVRQEHQHLSAAFAGRTLRAEGWSPERIQAVQHCIRAHRFRDPSQQPESLEAQVLFDADKLDAIGAIGVARALAYAARQGQPLYARPSAAFIHSGRRDPASRTAPTTNMSSNCARSRSACTPLPGAPSQQSAMLICVRSSNAWKRRSPDANEAAACSGEFAYGSGRPNPPNNFVLPSGPVAACEPSG